jgi:hypothetical protein
MTQHQVLRARGRPDGVGLHEAECVQRARQRRWREETARDRSAPQVIEGHRVPLLLRIDAASRWPFMNAPP